MLKGVNFGSILDPSLPSRLLALEKFITPSTTTIICWGDSLTEGAGAGGSGNTYPAQLATLTGRTVLSRGLGGQAGDQVIARQGGIGATVTVSGNQIPASGAVSVTAISITLLNYSGGAQSLTGTLAGVAGTLSQSGGSYMFTRTLAGTATACFPGTNFIPDQGDNQFYLPVFWIGRNQFNYAQSAGGLSDQVANVKANIAEAIDFLRPVDKRFIVLGVSSGANAFEYVGTDNYNAKRTLAAALARSYPQNFIDIDSVLVNSGTGSGQDLTDFNNGIVPASLRADDQHLNASGYAIVAQQVKNLITSRGW